MNTHVKDNLLETAPAKVTTAGDMVYATAANALARLGLGAATQFLVGGASVPMWSNQITGGPIIVSHTDQQFRMTDSNDADDVDDHFSVGKDSALFVVQHRDDSTSTVNSLLEVERDDFILHTGTDAQGAGAVVIATDSSSSTTALTTAGITYLDVLAVVTGGPAYVKGFWMVDIERTSAASSSSVSIIPRQDGSNLGNAFNYGSDNVAIGDNILVAANDIHTFTGTFFRRVTATDTSDYELFLVAGDNSRFQALQGFMYVESIQYPE